MSKSPKQNIVPFDYKLNQYFKDNFFVRTWTRPKSAPPVCQKFQILNVFKINFLGKYNLSQSMEHSKWAVAEKRNIACFSDLNHGISQSKRGGNIICFYDKKVANLLRKTIISKDKC